MEALLRRYPGLTDFPRADLGVRATPVEEWRIDGLDVLVKREDRTSAVYGGNKARALEFLLAAPARRLLTFSTLSAYHAFAVAAHGAKLGLETTAILVRRGARTSAAAALEASGATVRIAGGPARAALAAALRLRPGTRIVPPGGMSPRGALGYLAAAFELEPIPKRIYLPLGSGTTTSGLLAGLMLREADVEVVAVRVADRIAGWPPLVWRRAFRAVALLHRHDPAVPRPARGRVRLRVVPAPGAYGEETPETRAAADAAAPLPLEPAYTAKALAVLLRERPAGALYLHTFAGPVGAGTPAPTE